VAGGRGFEPRRPADHRTRCAPCRQRTPRIERHCRRRDCSGDGRAGSLSATARAFPMFDGSGQLAAPAALGLFDGTKSVRIRHPIHVKSDAAGKELLIGGDITFESLDQERLKVTHGASPRYVDQGSIELKDQMRERVISSHRRAQSQPRDVCGGKAGIRNRYATRVSHNDNRRPRRSDRAVYVGCGVPRLLRRMASRSSAFIERRTSSRSRLVRISPAFRRASSSLRCTTIAWGGAAASSPRYVRPSAL
jgi:hypothetical protein